MDDVGNDRNRKAVFNDHSQSSWMVRASVAGLLVVLCFLTGFSVLTQRHVAGLSRQADQTNDLAATLQDARFWVGQEESLERKYRLEPGADVRALHTAAERSLDANFTELAQPESSAATRALSGRLRALNARYVAASAEMLDAVDAHHLRQVIYLDHQVVDPIFGAMQDIVYQHAEKASRVGLGDSDLLRRQEASATSALTVAFGAGLALLLGFSLVIARFRRRLDAAREAEVTRLAEIAITDPLTQLRNHRTFHEDLARGLHSAGRSGVPVSLVLLDLDYLKQVNDELGHQTGDERLTALADAIRATGRGDDCGYRIGGDEFAVILNGVRAWNALEYVQRLRVTLLAATDPVIVTASAGVSEATGLRVTDDLIREADLALMSSKRDGQHVTIYTPEMNPEVIVDDADQDHHNRTLASALARAVDAKDSYTRSHCQTVSQLTGLIAAELGLDDARLASIRLAGLLHDVGKIGIPDAILNKPGSLTDEEYLQMQTHSLLGYDIVAAADLPLQARWVRHHHERYDGHGYPDGLAGEDIPLESRIILVADAFEAMTSNRPYRQAPGQTYALSELRRHAGTQFDAQAVDALCRALDEPVGSAYTSPAAEPIAA